MNKNFTHTGWLTGNDARTRSESSKRILLRETKNFWVDKWGTKYRKIDGYPPTDFPIYSIDISKIDVRKEDKMHID